MKIENIVKFYREYSSRVSAIRRVLDRPLTLTEKILFSHKIRCEREDRDQLAKRYGNFSPDRIAMQDATAQMAVLQFMQSGQERAVVPTTIHCDHLIQAKDGASIDLKVAVEKNSEVYSFLKSASQKYGIGFWEPGAGIIHQVVLEKYALPGMMIIGTDSHTPNGGGVGMLAIGVGGADAVDVMVGLPWELKLPKIMGVKLTGKLKGWSSAKDVILKLASMISVKGGTGFVIEYFGEGVSELSATGRATICNMGAEVGATSSLFPSDIRTTQFLSAVRKDDKIISAVTSCSDLVADSEVLKDPESYYDSVITINLSELEPYINGPFTPDLGTPLSQFRERAKQEGWPLKLDVGLIGSCTNSSYEDLSRVASVVEDALTKGLKVKSDFTITPGSEQIRTNLEANGTLDTLAAIGGKVLANACGPCIGQWARAGADTMEENSIMTSFNRNFAKRNDGNAKTHGFVASPEIVTAFSLAGRLDFDPRTDPIINSDGEPVMLISSPKGDDLPEGGFIYNNSGFVSPNYDPDATVDISDSSDRLQRLVPFSRYLGEDFIKMRLLIQVEGKCTTDHISMAGPWLRYRGHLENISDNLLIGAVNRFGQGVNRVYNYTINDYSSVPDSAKLYKEEMTGLVIVGDENYGEGSSREHAAMEPRFLNVRVVLVKSFARIHETNLKKQGVLALTFTNPEDYLLVREDDHISVIGLDLFSPDSNLTVELEHSDGDVDTISVIHTYNEAQIEWFKAGSCLNHIRSSHF